MRSPRRATEPRRSLGIFINAYCLEGVLYVRDRVRGPRWSDKDGDTMVEGKWRERKKLLCFADASKGTSFEVRGMRMERGSGIRVRGIGTRMSPTGEDEGEGGQCTRVEESLVLETRTRTRTGPKGQR